MQKQLRVPTNPATLTRTRILEKLQHLDELHEFTPHQQQDYDRLEAMLENDDY